MTSAALGVHNNAPNPLTPLGSVDGKLDPSTGVISTASFSTIGYHEPPSPINTNSTETIDVSQKSPGSATGIISSSGDVTLSTTISIFITIVQPVKEQCRTTASVTLQSTTPYNSIAKNVLLSDTHFTINDFQATSTPTPTPHKNCGLAHGELNTRFAGSTGNDFSLGLHGTLPLPPPPAAATTTTLSVTPASPVLSGTTVTLTAHVSSATSGTFDTNATVQFMSGTTNVGGPRGLSGGVATLTTNALPVLKNQRLTAVYSGNSAFAGSTSAPFAYTVEPKPTVGGSFPVAVVTGAAPIGFALTLTNPHTGQSWSNLWLQLRFTGIATQRSSKMSLSYKNTLGTWCPVTLTGTSIISGTVEGTSGACGTTASFSLTTGTSTTITFRISVRVIGAVGHRDSVRGVGDRGW